MRRWLCTLVLLCVSTALAGAQDKAAPKKILLVTHSGGYIHSSVVEAEKVLRELGPKHGFELTCWRYTNDPGKKATLKKKVDGVEKTIEGSTLDVYSERFQGSTRQPVSKDQIGRITAASLKPFDAVFFFTTGNPVETKEEMAALLDYIKSGKGFLGTHCATDTLYGMKEYGEMIGAYFDGHPLGGKTKILVEDTKHPITAHLGSSFEIGDELYQFRDPYSRDKLRVLMRLDPLWVMQRREENLKNVAKSRAKQKADAQAAIAKLEKELEGDLDRAMQDTKKLDVQKLRAQIRKWELEPLKSEIRRTDNDYAMAWVRDYGKGRVFYTALGHGENVWRDARFQQMIVQAIRWTTFQIDGSTAPSGATK